MVLSGSRQLEAAVAKLGELVLALGSAEAGFGLICAPSLLLAELRASLERRFRTEEGDGHYGTVLEEAPLLAPRVDGLKRQHGAMLAALEALDPMAADAERWWELEAPLSGFIATFRAHERAESRLVSDFIRGLDGAGRC
jgi:hypothetical protein